MHDNSASVEALSAHEQALRGDFGLAEQVLTQLARDPTREGKAWWLCLRLLQHMAGASPMFDDADEDVERAPNLGGVLRCGHRTLQAVAAFDTVALARCAQTQRMLASTMGDRVAVVWALRAELWLHTLSSQTTRAASEALEHAAREAGVAPVVIEAPALGALTCLDQGDVAGATALARRASRMARSEGLVHQEYLANIVLARVRRSAGRAYLATRILNSLASVVPPMWQQWIEWELCFAGAMYPAASSTTTTTIGSLMERLLSAASEGRRLHVETHLADLVRFTGGAILFRADVERLAQALDPAREASTHPWCRGGEHQAYLPIEARWGGRPESSLAYVMVSRSVSARRVLRSGLGLLPSATATAAIDSSERRDARAHSLLAVLGLASPQGLTEPEAFGSLYGFPYVREKHDGAFRVVIHRARELLADRGDLRRHAGMLELRVRDTLLVPDPRCTRSLDEMILHQLGASVEPRTSQEVAQKLGVSARAVQLGLRRLQEDGVCQPAQHGPRNAYRVEDTTFLEPTRARIRLGSRTHLIS